MIIGHEQCSVGPHLYDGHSALRQAGCGRTRVSQYLKADGVAMSFVKKLFRNEIKRRARDIYERKKNEDIENRRLYKNSMFSHAVGSIHTDRCVVLPDRTELLRKIFSGGVVAEIGVAFGDYTAEIMSINKPSRLHLVDAWDSERYQAGLQSIKDKFASEIGAGSVVINQGYSTDVLETFPDGYFDWVYIDTDHSYETTYKELILSSRKVKRGGQIAGHDFCTGNVVKPVPYGVIEACNRFCVEEGWRYQYLAMASGGHMSFSLISLDA